MRPERDTLMEPMLANLPSPRPGFTHVAWAREQRRGPVVVVVSGSPSSVAALRRGAAEAAMQSVHLHVLDSCRPAGIKDRLLDSIETVGDRDRSTALSILRNPNVITSPVLPGSLEEILAYCQEVASSLLVMDIGCLGELSETGDLGSLVDEIDLTCDLLLVRDTSKTS